VTHAEYRALAGANYSTLKAMALSPAHYRARVAEPSRDSDAMRRGRAMHAAVFEPEAFAARFPTWDGRRAGKEWLAFLAACRGDYLLATETEQVRAVAAAVRSHPDAGHMLVGGRAEHIIQWTDAETGIACKARLDYLRPGALLDLKTCRDASPLGFGRAAARMYYHVQSAFYGDGVLAVTGALPVPYIVAVETEPPYVVQVYRVNDDAYECGRETYRGWLRTLAECRATDRWPAYREGVTELCLPNWVFGDEDGLDGLGLVFGDESADDAA
jgi:hypothetical protein